ncbi:pantoate--beta-alanine ligase [soil metagenome]
MPALTPRANQSIPILRTNAELTVWRAAREREKVAVHFVPTMGALHAGHGALIRAAAGYSGEGAKNGMRAAVLVSIFVNPTQFTEAADLARYPRTLEADAELCLEAGASAVYAPGVEEIYPTGLEVLTPALPRVATAPRLEDAVRPGHFAGVCQVVARLFDLARPARAFFGEKDWQQLQVVRALEKGRGNRVEIVAVETVREGSGLALSSRNRFLGGEERGRAEGISRALTMGAGAGDVEGAEGALRRELERAGLEIQYAVVRDAETLEALGSGVRVGRMLIAVKVGGVRLIDNMRWERV